MTVKVAVTCVKINVFMPGKTVAVGFSMTTATHARCRPAAALAADLSERPLPAPTVRSSPRKLFFACWLALPAVASRAATFALGADIGCSRKWKRAE